MSTPSHLHSDVREALDLPIAERIAFSRRDRWVPYTHAKNALHQLDSLFDHPQCLRMRNILLVARSGNGKSSILEHFTNQHRHLTTSTGEEITPLVVIEMSATPNETELWSRILKSCNVSHREKDPAYIKKRQVKAVFEQNKIRMLVIDEFNNLVNAGKSSGLLLAGIKELSNELRISIVAAGTQHAVNALNSDPHMKSRFDPLPLPRWKWDVEYRRFLASYEPLLPLPEPSGLSSPELSKLLHDMAGETIGNTVALIKAVTVHAIGQGVRCITRDIIQSTPWVKPQEWDAVSSLV